ncbi:MAG: ABC transporter permease [Alphaproteobacteria bacterium]|nr:ABC transporter permease [Alphaproteobacteria bacterium]
MSTSGPTLARQLGRAEAKARLKSFGLVAPLLVFILASFALPIATLLVRSVHNPEVAAALPATAAALQIWDGARLPDEAAFGALAQDLLTAPEDALSRAASRFNSDLPGGRALLLLTARALKASKDAPSRARFVQIDPRWGEQQVWVQLGVALEVWTAKNFVTAMDYRYDENRAVVAQPREKQLYVTLFLRTLWVAGAVTLLCLVLGYPLAYVLAQAPQRLSNILMIFVLLPFWTSLIVRTTSWIVLLQDHGPINDMLLALGLIDDKSRLALIYNATGTLIAMTHILLPFMVLPLYSVMRGIPPTLTRAALSLGAPPFLAFLRVFLPLSVPGIAAGSLLVFILALGYYITPALVGGLSGELYSNQIAFHMQSSLNWGLASALSVILLSAVIGFYFVYMRIIGAEGLRLT